MRTDEERNHNDQHRVYEHIIRMELAKGFPDDPGCQTAVLLELLAEQVGDMQDVKEVRATFQFLIEMMATRMINDHVLFDTQGSA